MQVFRSNTPGGEVNYRTYVLESIGTGPAESMIFFPSNLPPYVLVEGTNTLAVEIHQIMQFSSTDMSFDCELAAFLTDDASRLTAARRDGQIELRWPAWTDRLKLFSTPDLSAPVVWTPVGNAAENVSGEWTVRVPIGGGPQYFHTQAP